jgi:hypothetical protein
MVGRSGYDRFTGGFGMSDFLGAGSFDVGRRGDVVVRGSRRVAGVFAGVLEREKE